MDDRSIAPPSLHQDAVDLLIGRQFAGDAGEKGTQLNGTKLRLKSLA